jgi:diguanylate cyclase (GGDEF)-like protein
LLGTRTWIVERGKRICSVAVSAALLGVPIIGLPGLARAGVGHGPVHGSSATAAQTSSSPTGATPVHGSSATAAQTSSRTGATPQLSYRQDQGDSGRGSGHDQGNGDSQGNGNGHDHGNGGDQTASYGHDQGSGNGQGNGDGQGVSHVHDQGNAPGGDNGHGHGHSGGDAQPMPPPALHQVAVAPAPAPPATVQTPESNQGNGNGNGDGRRGNALFPAQGPGNGHGRGHGHGNNGAPPGQGQGQNGNGVGSCDGLCHGGQTPALSAAALVATPFVAVSPTPTPAAAIVTPATTPVTPATTPVTPSSTPATSPTPSSSSTPSVPVTPTTFPSLPTTPKTSALQSFLNTSSRRPVGLAGIAGARPGATSGLTPLLTGTAALTLPAAFTPVASGLGALAPATAAIGLTPAAATSAGAGATTTAGTHAAGHHTGESGHGGGTTILFMPHFINHIPEGVWIALGASLLLAAIGAAAAVASRRRAAAQAGELAAVSAAALTDPLTGVLNRRGFIEAVERELARARRYHHPFVLAYVDVRGLKTVNDTEGHLAGDNLLKSVAALLTECARADDVVGRLGGDELGLLLVEQTPEAAMVVTRRIADQVAARRKVMNLGAPWDLTIGSAAFPQDGQTVDELLATADRRLYQQRGIQLAGSR